MAFLKEFVSPSSTSAVAGERAEQTEPSRRMPEAAQPPAQSPAQCNDKRFVHVQSGPSMLPKHRQVHDELLAAIKSGEYAPGDRLPSEIELGRRYDTSRITIAKAVNELQKQGFVSRRAGSGTHVLPHASSKGHLFGLLIPDLGRTEIFEPICHGMMRSPVAKQHSLLWGHAVGSVAEQEHEAEQLCYQYIAQKVSGVFFAPLELTPRKDIVNRRIVSALERARIPVVLLDRCLAPYPERSSYDMVGIDNQRSGFMIANHLMKFGCSRIAFFALPFSAPTVDARAAGWRNAHFSKGIALDARMEWHGDPEDAVFIKRILKESDPQAIMCANDATAARLMHTLQAIGVGVPEEIRITGIDDVKYAAMLPVPLTTQHQDCADIGSAAMATMLSRIAHPELPVRDILLQTRTVVRASCGARLPPLAHSVA